MITDERLKCFVSGIDLENITAQDEINMAQEIISLRSQKAKLIKAGSDLESDLSSEFGWDENGIGRTESCRAWAALLKELETPKE